MDRRTLFSRLASLLLAPFAIVFARGVKAPVVIGPDEEASMVTIWKRLPNPGDSAILSREWRDKLCASMISLFPYHEGSDKVLFRMDDRIVTVTREANMSISWKRVTGHGQAK